MSLDEPLEASMDIDEEASIEEDNNLDESRSNCLLPWKIKKTTRSVDEPSTDEPVDEDEMNRLKKLLNKSLLPPICLLRLAVLKLRSTSFKVTQLRQPVSSVIVSSLRNMRANKKG